MITMHAEANLWNTLTETCDQVCITVFYISLHEFYQ